MTGSRAALVAGVAGAVLAGCTASPPPGPRADAAPGTAATPTFARDVAPVLHARCVSCHRDGGPAPFALSSLDDARRHGREVSMLVGQRLMPPWLPAEGYGTFADSRRLGDAEVAAITGWVAAGMPPGEGPAPAPPPASGGWQLGEPDLVLEMGAPFPLPDSGPDVFRNFVLPISLDAPVYVEAVELVTASPRALHHGVLRIDGSRSCRHLDAADGEPGWDGMLWGEAAPPGGRFVGFTPGRIPRREPGLAWRLRPGEDLVLGLHLVPSGSPEQVTARVGLHVAAAPPDRRPFVVSLGSQIIDIPAGAGEHAVRDRYVLPVDVDVVSVYPHAHYLGRRITALATAPDGATRWLLRIDDWDIRWQDEYTYAEPVRLPRGTTLAMEIVFDNSEGNFRNPSRPPVRVRYGPRSTDEMAEVILQVLPVSLADHAVLRRDFERKALEDALASHAARLVESPDDASVRTGLGLRLLQAGRGPEALPHLERALQLSRERRAPALLNLGAARQATGDLDAAEGLFRRALDAEPRYAEAAVNLGNVLMARGRAADAAASYGQAVGWDSTSVAALEGLALAHRARGELDAAVERYRQALRIDPDGAALHYNLGNALAAQGRMEDAARSYEAALEADPLLPEAHQNLGTAYVRLGRKEDARARFAEAARLRPGWAAPRESLARLGPP